MNTWAQVRKFDSVLPSKFQRMQDWLLFTQTLKATEKVPWPNLEANELLSLSPKRDRLDEWLAQYFVRLWQFTLGETLKAFRNRKEEAEEDPEKLRQRETSSYGPKDRICCLFVSCTILVGSITALNFSKTTQVRLVLLSVFTVEFSCTMKFVARCRRFEVFAGTATFCAILIVFLQGLGQETKG